MTEYVTTADALFFHKELIARYGGAPGIRDVGALESALHRPQTGYYETIVHEAAALFESLVQNQRVAFAVVDVFVRVNGYRLTADSQSIYRFMMTLFAKKSFDMDHLVPWLETIVQPSTRNARK